MAQHSLDVIRDADSSRFSNDYERGNAWRYRDYVVRPPAEISSTNSPETNRQARI
jgi:hypothetical protein